MSTETADGATVIEIEFDTGAAGGAALGDVAASLISVDELLRDLASLTAFPLTVEFRNIEIVAIDLRAPLKVRLRLVGIAADALAAFEDICRDIITSRERLPRLPVLPGMTEQEERRLAGHISALHHAAIPLTRVRRVPASELPR